MDDDPAHSRLCIAVAESVGLAAAGTAVRSADAIGLALHADIMLLDQQLEGADTGLDVLRQVREKRLPLKVVVMTAHGSEQLAVEALRLGADDYLIKDEGFTGFLPQVLRRVAHLRNMELQLAAARELVVQAERRAAIGEISVAISHEMNNPLMALRAQLEVLHLDARAMSEQVRSNIAAAITQVDRIAAVVKRVAQHKRDSSISYVGGTRMTDLRRRHDDQR